MRNTQTSTRRRAKTAKADAQDDAASPAPSPQPVPDTEPVTPQLLTAELADELARQNTTRFDLPNTGKGAYAEVQRFDFNDPNVLMSMPQHLLSQALRMVMDLDGENPVTDEDGSINPEKALRVLSEEQQLAREVVKLCFITPRVTEDRSEVGGSTVHVDQIHPADRRAFMYWCLGPIAQEASSLSTFPVESA